uniref:Uncharacterized protein n=1 Tax=Tanacetum cinerariifolium TaxID=118510 RepID=A0A6L2JWM3_TANCI|nr:hypothetical protein [Tanacetum cinerariifolium]
MIAGGHYHLVIRAHRLHATLGLLLHAMFDHDPIAVSTLLPQRESNMSEAAAAGLMIAGGHYHLVIRAHHLHATLGLLLHAMLDHDPIAVSTLLPQRESNMSGLFHLEKRGIVEKGRTHDRLLLLDAVHLQGVQSWTTGLRPTTGQGVQAYCQQWNVAVVLSRMITLLALESLFHYVFACHLENLMLVDNGDVGLYYMAMYSL